MLTIMRGCVAHNDLSRWPTYSRSFSHEFAIKLLKYVTYCRVRPTAHTVLDGFFPYLPQMITIMRGCVARNDIWLSPLPSKSFSCDFAFKLLKYVTSSRVRSASRAVLYKLFPYLAHMITSVRGCVTRNEPWRWLISSRLFSCDFAYTSDERWGVTYHFQVNRSKVKVTRGIRIWRSGRMVS